MARIGLKNFKYSKLDESGKVTKPESLGKAVDCSVELTLNEAKLFADDGLAESDSSFNGGTISLSVDDDNDKVLAPLQGHEVSEEGEITRKSTDTAPYIALGRIVTKIKDGKYKYKVEILNKVKFKDTMPEETTKGETTEFTTYTIEGDVIVPDDGIWSYSQTFDTEAEAIEYLDKKLTASA